MLTLITGAPGSGKSCALVEILLELSKQRAIYANGVTDLTLPHTELTDPHQWPSTVPDGAAVVIDEVQRIWRSQDRAKVGPDVVALETHRHRGLDFYLVTQHPSLLHPNVRKLVGRHIHLQDFGILGRKWFEWTECSDSLKQPLVQRKYRLSKAAQQYYKSASMHIKPIRSMPKQLWVLALAVPVIAGLGWKVYDRISSVLAPKSSTAGSAVAVPSILAAAADGLERASGPIPAASADQPQAPSTAVPDVGMLGCVAMKNRCECIGSDYKVMTVQLDACRLNAARGGADMPYPRQVDRYQAQPTNSAWYPSPQRSEQVPGLVSTIDHPVGQPRSPQIIQ